MIRPLLLLCGLASLCAATEPKPILVVIEQSPWRMVIGSDSPTLALYDDGSLYYVGSRPNADEPFRKRVVADAARESAALLGFDPSAMKDFYELSAATDQASTVIWTPTKRIGIYGNWRKAPSDFAEVFDPQLRAINRHEREKWASLPAEIRAALQRIDEAREPKGQPWLPARIEVMLWPYEYAPDASIRWPHDWPGLTEETTRKRGDSFSVFLPSDQLPALRRFLASRKERGAVLIDGKKMAASFRFPFPAEATWMP